MLPSSFKGISYRLATNWNLFIDVDKYKNVPINYLEIGVFYGANLLSVANSYGMHPNSKLYAIDPWEDYKEYSEYKGQHKTIYETYCENIEISGYKEKITTCRGYSNNEILKFEDNFFDIIYIDGNHEPEFVLEDAVLSFRKLKPLGYMIFDDYGWGGPDLTMRGIDAFVSAYHKRIRVLGQVGSQASIKKLP